eukprot:1790859-Heterocapsa_arctica.AAC.1
MVIYSVKPLPGSFYKAVYIGSPLPSSQTYAAQHWPLKLTISATLSACCEESDGDSERPGGMREVLGTTYNT